MSESLKGALIIGQSGGPSSVINCSAYGIIKTGLENPNITKVYGAFHGIKRVLNDQLMIGAFVIFGDPELTTACAKALLARLPEYDYLLTAEAKGIPLIHEMARLAGNQRYMLARKAPKLYMRNML